jgi:hypothetical protein
MKVMARLGWKSGMALAIVMLGAACGDEKDPIELGPVSYFNGAVYNGATGARLSSYEISLSYRDREVEGRVDDEGGFFMGPLPGKNDYTVEIQAEGYRSFLAHNAPIANGQTYFYDAYLFPNDLKVSPVDFHVALSDSAEKPAGFIKLQPTAASLLYDDSDERPAGIPGQVWDNDEDLQFGSVVEPFADGKLSIPSERLVYGVSYAVTVFGIPGYQPLTGAFQAGVDGEQGFVVEPLTRSDIAVAFRSDVTGADPSGKLVVVFNVPVEFDPPTRQEIMRELVDANLSIDSSDEDNDGNFNVLKPDTDRSAAERGTKMTLDRNTLTLQWDPVAAFSLADAGDPIRAVIYGGLDAIRVRPVGTDSSQGTDLATLLGTDSVRVSSIP